MKRWALRALWCFLALAAAAWLVRTFVADVYHVESASMAPVLRGGGDADDWVLVRYASADELRRFDLAVALGDGPEAFVKRVVGLPGERVLVSGGDLFVDGRRLAPSVPRPQPVVLFDGALDPLDEHFVLDGRSWERSSRGLVELDARDARELDEAHLLVWRHGLHDGVDSGIGTRVVADGGLECLLDVEGDGRVRLELRESGDLFRAEIALGEGAQRIHRLHPDREDELLAEREVELAPGRLELSFFNVDNALALQVGDGPPLVATYDENRPPSRLALAPGRTVGPPVALGGEGVAIVVRELRVLRDLHWTERGELAVDAALALGPGEYFLLGDNSAHSLDGRELGPTPARDVIGRVERIVWPPARAGRVDELWVPAEARPAPAGH